MDRGRTRRARLFSLPYTSWTARGDASLPHQDAREAVVYGAASHGRVDGIDMHRGETASRRHQPRFLQYLASDVGVVRESCARTLLRLCEWKCSANDTQITRGNLRCETATRTALASRRSRGVRVNGDTKVVGQFHLETMSGRYMSGRY